MARTMADILRRKISKSGKTALEIAIATRVPQASLSAFLRGSDIRLGTAQKLAAYFNLELREAKPTKKP